MEPAARCDHLLATQIGDVVDPHAEYATIPAQQVQRVIVRISHGGGDRWSIDSVSHVAGLIYHQLESAIACCDDVTASVMCDERPTAGPTPFFLTRIRIQRDQSMTRTVLEDGMSGDDRSFIKRTRHAHSPDDPPGPEV